MNLLNDHLPGFCRYLQVLEGLAEISVVSYRKKVEEFFAWMEGNDNAKPAPDIGRQDIAGYLEWCYYRGNVNQTRYTKLTALGKFFRYLKYENIIPEDITLGIPKPVIHNKRMQSFTKEEILSFFRAIDITKEKGLRDAVIFILGAFCGLRISEICKLQVGHIIDDGKTLDVDVPPEIAKKHHGRTVILWKAPALFIRQHIFVRLNQGAVAGSPFLITYKNQRPSTRALTSCAVDSLIKRYAEKAGIRKTKISCHVLRTTHANDLQHIKGYTLLAIMERLGISDLSTVGRYLIRRERIHKTYNSLHEYWIDFPKVWSTEDKGGNDDNSSNELFPAAYVEADFKKCKKTAGDGGNAIDREP